MTDRRHDPQDPFPGYRELALLAEHDAVRTSLWEDEQTKTKVVIRELSLARAKSHEEVELFERESAVLEHIDHPRLPRILERWQDERDGDVKLYQVRHWVEGQSLFDEVKAGRHLTETEVLHTAWGVAETLAYLHQRSPALVHRDIKPQNLIRTHDDANDRASVSVIDLGAIKAGPSTGRTIVGTYGYMPPEQFEGRSAPASDVFALGMTLIFLLTHKEPGDFDDGGARAHFRAEANVSDATAALIDEMIAYDPADRPRDGAAVADRVQAILRPTQKPTPAAPARSTSKKPAAVMGRPSPLPPAAPDRSRREGGATFSLRAFFRPDGDGEHRWNHVEVVVMLILLIGVPLGMGVWSAIQDHRQEADAAAARAAQAADEARKKASLPADPPAAVAPFLGLGNGDAGLVMCAARLFPRLAQSEQRYHSWVGEDGPTGQERIVYGLYAGYDDAVERCQGEPELAAFAKVALPLVAKANRYYDEEDHRDDAFALGRALHPKLVASWQVMHRLEDKAVARIGQALADLPPVESDPLANAVRGLTAKAWALAFGTGTEVKDFASWGGKVAAVEETFEQTLRAVVDKSPVTAKDDKKAYERLEHHRQVLKKIARDAEKVAAGRRTHRDPGDLVTRLRDETMDFVESLVRDDQALVIWKRRVR